MTNNKNVKVVVGVDVQDSEVDALERKLNKIDDTPIKPEVDSTAAQVGIQNISDGFDRLKQGASELKNAMGEALEASGRMENTETFLAMNIGADQAKSKLEEIRSVTDKLPGDDVTLQNLLSQATVKDASLTAEAMTQMGQGAADYMAAMQNFGKSATETQQDLMNYILAGNTAEIERSPILQAHVDKLKEGTTVQERAKLLQEALNAEGWSGISQQDTYNNKLQQFNDMLARGQMNLGNMFNEGSKSAMDFLLKLDESTNGLVGMAFALGGMAQPLTDTIMGLGQMATGINAIKSLGFIKWLKEFELAQKLSTAATKIQTAWNWLLNESFLANPIVLVVVALIALAAAFVWAYYNVDWFRQMVDNAWASIVQFAQTLYNSIGAAIQWISNLFTQFTTQLGLNTNNWVHSVLGFILFMATMPLRIGAYLVDTIARALGFKGSFVGTLINTAISAVQGFANAINGIPQALQNCLNWAYNIVMSNPLVQALQWLGDQAVRAFSILGLGQGSPGDIVGAMENELDWTKEAIEKHDLANTTASLGSDLVSNFNPNLQTGTSARNGGTGNNITINIDSVDSEDRIRQIVQAVEDALKFDNLTAGRSV